MTLSVPRIFHRYKPNLRHLRLHHRKRRRIHPFHWLHAQSLQDGPGPHLTTHTTHIRWRLPIAFSSPEKTSSRRKTCCWQIRSRSDPLSSDHRLRSTNTLHPTLEYPLVDCHTRAPHAEYIGSYGVYGVLPLFGLVRFRRQQPIRPLFSGFRCGLGILEALAEDMRQMASEASMAGRTMTSWVLLRWTDVTLRLSGPKQKKWVCQSL